MTPTVATIAVCAAAEFLPAPIAVLVIDGITNRCEAAWSAAVAQAARLRVERDLRLEVDRTIFDLQTALSKAQYEVEAPVREALKGAINETNEDRRRRLFGLPSSMTAAEFEAISRNDPHMRRG